MTSSDKRPAPTEISLHHGDCVAGMAALAAESVDLVVTSPPYNLGIAYSEYKDRLDRGEYLDWSVRWAAQVRRVLKPGGSFFLNVGATPANPLLPHELVLKLQPLFCLQNTIHWIKSITVQPKHGPEMSVGHFKPLRGERFLTDCHEFVFHLSKSGDVRLDRLAIGVAYADKTNIARWSHTGGRDRRCRGNNWFVPYTTIRERKSQRPHPATFPVALATQCIRLHGVRPGMVMIDPLVGLGNAALAASECGVERFIGFDIDEQYLEEARRRLAAPVTEEFAL